MADGTWSETGDLENGDKLDFAPPDDAFVDEPVKIPEVEEREKGRGHISYHFPKFDNYDVGLFMGYILGDGAIGKGKFPTIQLSMSSKDREDVVRMNNIVRSWCSTETKVFERTVPRPNSVVSECDPAPMATVHWRIRGLFEFLVSLGLDKRETPDRRRAPRHVFEASKACVRGFLSGMFSTDGSVGSCGRRVSVSLASVSFGLLQDVQQLLLGFGIRSTICEYKARNASTVHRALFKLEIAASESVERFFGRIGFENKRKQAKLFRALADRDAAPKNRKSPKITPRSPKVTSVVSTGVFEPVYDLSVDVDHQFVADGVTVHNCYGTKFAPGYLKFAHQTLFWCSAEFASFTLVNTEIDRTIKPNRIRIVAGQLGGTIETQDKAYTNTPPTLSTWAYDVAAFRKISTDGIDVEFSTTAGATWFPITQINDPTDGAVAASGTIRLRVTLTRVSTATVSPDFEIARVRRAMPELRPNYLRQQRADVQGGEILVLRTQEQERVARAIAAGRQVDLDGDESWTLPLNIFSSAITANTPAARVDDRQAGGHPFWEQLDGIHEGQRNVITKVSFDENFRELFTRQVFSTRRAQSQDNSDPAQWQNSGEMYSLVW